MLELSLRYVYVCCVLCFFFQAEDGIRDLVRSRGLGDVYKRQGKHWDQLLGVDGVVVPGGFGERGIEGKIMVARWALSLIHI